MTRSAEFKIGKKNVGGNAPAFIVAELSANHLHDINVALKTIKSIKDSGADAVKIQTYTPDTITIDCRNKHFMIHHKTIWDGMNLYDLYKTAYTPWDWQPKLKKYADKLGLTFFSSPFDMTAVDFLEKMKVPAYKVASLEITDIPLIEYIASKGKPVIFATGIATLDDIKAAISACRKKGNNKISILKCVSEYPTKFENLNLRTIEDMKKRFNAVIGLSDHSLGIEAPIAAITLGAKIIEKHYILDRKMGGPDSKFSLEPAEFKAMVSSIRNVEQALGKATYALTPQMKRSREHCRSLFVVEDIKKGDLLTVNNIRSIRPGFGLPPKHLKGILGKKAKLNASKGTPLSWNLIK